MRQLGATCMALALRASFMFADREAKPVAGVIEYAPQQILDRAAPAESAIVVPLRSRRAPARLASGANWAVALRRAA